MDHTSLDALAERIARIGRRDSATSIPFMGMSDQVNRMTGLVDQAVSRLSHELAAVETRNSEAVTRAEMRAAKALDSVAVWLEKRDAKDLLAEKRLEERDALLTRNMSLLTLRLEEIDERLSRHTGPAAEPLRQTVGDIGRGLDRVSRAAPETDAASQAIMDALRDLDRRMQDVTARLDQDLDRAPKAASEASEKFGKLEAQLSEVLSAVRRAPEPARARTGSSRSGIAAAIDDITARQRMLDGDDGFDVDSADLDRTERALGELKREIGTLATRFSDPHGDVESRGDVRAQIMAISHALHDLAPRRQVNNIEAAIRDLTTKIESSRSEGTREALLAPIERLLTDVRLNLETFRDTGALDQINRRLETLQIQIDDGRRHGADPRAIEALARQLGEIRDLLNERGSGQVLSVIEKRISDIGQRLELIAERSPTKDRDPGIAQAIMEIRSLLDRADPARAIAEAEAKLSAQMHEHTRAMEARFTASERAGGQEVGALVDGLAGRLDQIQRVLADQGAPNEDIARLAAHVAMLEQKIDTLPRMQGEPGIVIDMVRQLADKVEIVESRMPDVLGLAEIVHRLADQVEAAVSVNAGPAPSTAALERQIASIAARLDQPMQGAEGMYEVQRAVGDLFAQIESLRHEGVSAAAEAARDAVRSALGEASTMAAGGNEGVAALAAELQFLRDAQGHADQRNHETLASVHQTLGKIVDRLAMLETDLADARIAQPAPSRADAAPVEGYGPSAARFIEPERTPSSHPLRAELAAAAPHAFQQPAKEKPASLVASMRSMLSRSQKAEAAPVPASAQPAAEFRNPSFLDEMPGEAAPALADDLEADLPLEPGTRQPKAMIRDEAPATASAMVAAGAVESARSDFLKLARQAMSGTSAPTANPKAEKAAAKAAKAARTERVSTLELSGTAKASTARKVVPLLGAAAVVAAAGIGGALWMRAPSGDAQQLQTNSIGPTTIEPGATEQPAPEALTAGEHSTLAPEASRPAPAARRIDTPQTTSSTAPAGVGDIAMPAVSGSAPPDAMSPSAFAQWPTGQNIETPDVQAQREQLAALAEKGDAAAQYELGTRLAEGRGMERDAKEGLKWLQRAAEKGLAPAQFRVGSMYREGKGAAVNNQRALDWFKRAAQRGNARAMHNLAVVLAEGVNGAPDYAGAGEWFRKAAEYGIKDSQFNVAILYARGLGLPQDLGEAYKWFDAAARQGDEDAGKKRDEVAARMDERRLELARSEAEAFRAKPLDPVANDVVVPSYNAPAAASADSAAPKT